MKFILLLCYTVAVALCLTVSQHTFGQQPNKLVLTDFPQFVKDLHASIERWHTTPEPKQELNFGLSARIMRDREPEFEVYDGSIGHTTQGEINKVVGSGEFEWEGVVSRIVPASKGGPGSSYVSIALPDVGKPPHGWEIVGSISFFALDTDLEAQKVSIGTRVVVAGSLAKTPFQPTSGVTALHGVGKKAGTNRIQIATNPKANKLVRVVDRATK